MNSIEINNWKKDPTIVAIVKATFPDYRRQKVYVKPGEAVELHDLNWSGGTRSEYRACSLSGVSAGDASRYNACAPWANPAEGLRVSIPAGMVVVRGGHFCGKVSALTLHVNPSDMPKYIGARNDATN